MSERYPGGIISRSPPTIVAPTGIPPEGGSAPGVWTLEQAASYIRAGTWPRPILDKQLWTWGFNNEGQLGQGNSGPGTYRSSPVQIGSDVNWASILTISAGSSLAIRTTGTLWSWGSGGNGQLGLGNTTSYSSPKQVGTDSNWSQLAGGNQFVMAIRTNGTLWGWGRGSLGQLGIGVPYSRSSPSQVGALTTWASVAAGFTHTLGIRTDGTLWTWGENDSGQLGHNNSGYGTNRSSPVQVGLLSDWVQAAGGNKFSLAIRANGTLWSWGANGYGQLGRGSSSSYSSPVQVGSDTNWSFVACGNIHVLARKTTGTLWAWGRNEQGQLGLGDSGTGTDRRSPVQVGSLTDWNVINGATQFSSATRTNGTLWTWGNNNGGRLGLGNTTNRSSPTQVGALTTWIRLNTASSAYQVIATKSP